MRASKQALPDIFTGCRHIRQAEKGCRMQDAVACEGLQHQAAAAWREAAKSYVL